MWIAIVVGVLGIMLMVRGTIVIIDDRINAQDQVFTGHFAELSALAAEADGLLKDRIVALEARVWQLEGRRVPRETSPNFRRGWDADPDLDSGNDAVDLAGRN